MGLCFGLHDACTDTLEPLSTKVAVAKLTTYIRHLCSMGCCGTHACLGLLGATCGGRSNLSSTQSFPDHSDIGTKLALAQPIQISCAFLMHASLVMLQIDGISAYRDPRPALLMVSSAAVERNAVIGDDAAKRKQDIPIVQLNPGGTLNHKYAGETAVRSTALPYTVIRSTGALSMCYHCVASTASVLVRLWECLFI